MIDIVTKNIQQIGTVTEEDRIYIADKVYKTIMEEQQREKNTYVLMGHTESSGGRYATFIEGAIKLWEVEYENGIPKWSNRVWNEVFCAVKKKYENMIIVGWALERKGYPMNVGPEIEKLHREQFGGAHQLFYFVDSLEKESYFYVNRNNHLRQKKGFFVYYRLEERFDEPDRIKIEIPNELEPRREKAGEYTRKIERGTRKGEYRQYIVSQQTKQENCEGAGFVVVFVAAIVIAIGIGAYTGMDMLRKHRDRTVEVISTEGTVEMQEKTKGKTSDSPDSKNTENNLIPVEKVPGGSLAN